jgi:hypothetical protein
MNEQKLRQKIRNIGGDVLGLSNALYTLESLNFKLYPNNFAEHSLDTAMKAEKIACRLRHLIGECGMIRREYLMKQVADAHGITVEQSEKVITITLPHLLPKATRPRSGEFIVQPLHYAMQKHCSENEVYELRECTVCFVHIYDENLSLSRIRDYDNVETRNVLNAVSTFFMTDDSGRLCDVFHTTKLGKDPCTQIHIMPKEEFQNFIFGLENDV